MSYLPPGKQSSGPTVPCSLPGRGAGLSHLVLATPLLSQLLLFQGGEHALCLCITVRLPGSLWLSPCSAVRTIKSKRLQKSKPAIYIMKRSYHTPGRHCVIGISVPKLSTLKTYDNTSLLSGSGYESWMLSPNLLLISTKRNQTTNTTKQESFSTLHSRTFTWN